MGSNKVVNITREARPIQCDGILDRAKDMIVTGGENVYSGEVEAVICAPPAVREAAAFGISDPRRGEVVMACIMLKPGSTLNVDDLTAFCRKSYKIPRCLEFLHPELPKSGSGKILKRLLRERFWVSRTSCKLTQEVKLH